MHMLVCKVQALQAACLAAAAKGQQTHYESYCALFSCFFQGTCSSVDFQQSAPTDNLCASSCVGQSETLPGLKSQHSPCLSWLTTVNAQECRPMLGTYQVYANLS